MTWRYKSLIVFGLGLFLAIVLFIQMGLYLYHHVFGTFIHYNVFQLCISLFSGNTILYHLVLFLVNSFIAWTFIMVCIKIIKQVFFYSKMKNRMKEKLNHSITEKMNTLFNRGKKDIYVIQNQEPVAYTVGFIRPIIIISTNLIELLDKNELEAVIHHETAHQKYNDPFKVFLLQLISEVMWYIPIAKWCYENYKIMVELVADEYAVKCMGSEVGLGSALIKLIKSYIHNRSTAPVFVPFSDGSVNYRIKQLLEPESSIPVKCPLISIIFSINMIAFLMILMMMV
ncbi:M56 family metallopeptidase [Metabacillus halosaccharovorans]|uniref:M56 family metallopeptidase n=1 Tax=Metabacillus halosaccharovorans TaxID=930124 RepID=UPI00203C5B39|nr:M56 family metallopeptidase [Metabacillus halosaccharovorans]MCM3440185.1 M56 family metallopeptidase [Metabacillus halosaccharovorans]